MLKCHDCVHRRPIPGDCHISCADPDPNVRGNAHGVSNGWFWYPYNFDPIWGVTDCSNFTAKEKVNNA